MSDPLDRLEALRREFVTGARMAGREPDGMTITDALDVAGEIVDRLPALLVVARAAELQAAAYEHDQVCEEEGEGDCCMEANHQAYLVIRSALDRLAAEEESNEE